jgi:hypothetical protein
MSCERFRDALTELAAGGPAAAGLEAHLSGCTPCTRELASLREALGVADAVLAGIASAEPSPELRARLRRRVDEAWSETAGDRFAWRWPWLATAATICAAVVVAALWRGGAVARRPVSSLATPAPVATTATGAAGAAGRDLAALSGSSRVVAQAGASHREASARLPTPLHQGAGGSASHRPAEPEVLVPAGEREAFLQFVALVHEQKVSPPALLAAGQPSPDLAEPRDVRIEPLEIAPLDPAEAQGM